MKQTPNESEIKVYYQELQGTLKDTRHSKGKRHELAMVLLPQEELECGSSPRRRTAIMSEMFLAVRMR